MDRRTRGLLLVSWDRPVWFTTLVLAAAISFLVWKFGVVYIPDKKGVYACLGHQFVSRANYGLPALA